VKVALSGDGGDELFAGYTRYLGIQKLKVMDHVPGAVRRAISRLADRLPYSAYGKNFLRMIGRPNALERYFDNNYTPYFLRRELLEPEWMLPADAAFLRRTFSEYLLPGGADILSQALQFETTANLTGDMLVKVDRMSMANSLEVRCPLLDHHVAELAASIPHEWKLRNGRGKYILMDALRDYLPAELLNRGKMGFGVPLALWFRGSLREFLWDHLTGKSFLGRGIVSEPFLRTLLEEHQRGRRDTHLWLWSLLMLELWFRNFEEPLAA
jgi:asparagine synthase (glutamine-hydrolysing)